MPADIAPGPPLPPRPPKPTKPDPGEKPKPAAVGGIDFAALVAALRVALAEAGVPALLDGAQARRYVGLSKSSWHRAKSAGLIPAPVYVEGAGNRYRRADLDKFVERLKPRRKLRVYGNDEAA